MGVREAYRRFFEEKPEDAQALEDNRAWADGTIALWGHKAFRALVDKIEVKANEPLGLGDATAMAGQIGRTNGIKEVLTMIRSDLLRARKMASSATGAGPEE